MIQEMGLLDDARFNEHVATTAEKFNVPGIAISLVDLSQNSIASKGYSFSPADQVTEDTVFQLYSNTKLFTAVAYGILVDAGKCRWDSKLCDLLPNLQLQDDYAQRTLTVEDMLSHQSGLTGHLLVECFTSLHLDNVVEAINGLRFTLPPRTKYQYCNIAIGLVGYIVTKISGMTFEDFVRTHILEPLDMRDTTWSKPSAGRNVVQGYITTWKDERLSLKTHLAATMLPHESISAATGGMLTTAADMAKWLAFLLRLTGGKSTPEDRKILTPETMKQLMRSRVLASDQIGGLCVRPGESLYEELGVPTYAQSQLLGSYRGVNIASHNGCGYAGGVLLLWTPGSDFGICVLTNVFGSVFHAGISIALTALDMHLGRSVLDWNERLALQPWAQNDTPPPAPKEENLPKSPLDGLCGIFEAPTYGRLTVLSLDADADKSEADDASLDILRRYKASEPFGKTWQRKPTLLAVFRETMTWYIFELYHIKEDIYLGVGVILFDRAKDPSQIVRVPVYTTYINTFARFEFSETAHGNELEYYAEWVDEPNDVGIGRGTATFMKR